MENIKRRIKTLTRAYELAFAEKNLSLCRDLELELSILIDALE